MFRILFWDVSLNFIIQIKNWKTNDLQIKMILINKLQLLINTVSVTCTQVSELAV